jgi:hypothetical protein
MKTLQRLVLGLVLGLSSALADEPKNHDFDVITEESKVPPYVLPPLLVSENGRAITTPEEWFRIRRPRPVRQPGLRDGPCPS